MFKTYKVVALSFILFLGTALPIGAKEKEEEKFPPEFES